MYMPFRLNKGYILKDQFLVWDGRDIYILVQNLTCELSGRWQ